MVGARRVDRSDVLSGSLLPCRAPVYLAALRSIDLEISRTRALCCSTRSLSASGPPPITCCPAAFSFSATAGSDNTALTLVTTRSRIAGGMSLHPNSPAPPTNVNSP